MATGGRGQLVRDGARVVIAGLPNVGKSSVFNALVGADRAIVTPVAGTTRDLVSERIVIDGALVLLVDTAGLRDGADASRRKACGGRAAAMAAADVVVVVLDRSRPMTDGRAAICCSGRGTRRRSSSANKADLPSAPDATT